MGDESVSPVSRKRWIVLFVVVFLNITNSILWMSFVSISNYAAEFYQVSEKMVDLFSFVFCIATVAVGLLVVWIVDKNGLKMAILVGASLNALGALFRILTWFGMLFPVTMSGQIFAALAQPFLYCIPTKVAEQWFPDNQRAFATSLGVIANLAGQVIACGVTPLFVTSPTLINYMNTWYGSPCFLALIIAIFTIRSSKPENPPSNSAAISTNYPYFSALRTFFFKKESIFLICAVGSVLGVSYTLMSRMEEILCRRGYENAFSGWCTMCLMLSGLLGAVLASIVADWTKCFIPIIKICLAFMVVALCLFSVVSRWPDNKPVILVACGLVGFWGYAAFPVGLELALEHSFTVLPEATSSGLVLITGQFLSIIYFVFFETLATPDNIYSADFCTRMELKQTVGNYKRPKVVPLDTTCPVLTVAGVTTFFVVIFILFFKSDYNRMKTENRSMSAIVNDDDPIVSSTSFEDPSWHTSIYS